MTKERFSIGEKNYTVYKNGDPEVLLFQPLSAGLYENMDTELKEITKRTEQPFAMVAFEVSDWDKELSPWQAPAVFGDENFGDGAYESLQFVLSALIPDVLKNLKLSAELPMILGGYSLAGFFSLWSAYQTDAFQAVVAASPSVWFPGWLDYAEEHTLKAKCVYLSLGTKEEKTRHPVMRKVGDAIRIQKEILDTQHIVNTLEWNPGNHFLDSELRTAKGFARCIGQLTEKNTL